MANNAYIRTSILKVKRCFDQFVDQCFIITHQPELEEAVTGRAYRLERDKKKDETTKVVLLS